MKLTVISIFDLAFSMKNSTFYVEKLQPIARLQHDYKIGRNREVAANVKEGAHGGGLLFSVLC